MRLNSMTFVSLPAVETAIARVASRARQGGHDVPEAVFAAALQAGTKNFQLHYKHAVDDWAVYDSSGTEPVMIEWGENR